MIKNITVNRDDDYDDEHYLHYYHHYHYYHHTFCYLVHKQYEERFISKRTR